MTQELTDRKQRKRNRRVRRSLDFLISDPIKSGKTSKKSKTNKEILQEAEVFIVSLCIIIDH